MNSADDLLKRDPITARHVVVKGATRRIMIRLPRGYRLAPEKWWISSRANSMRVTGQCPRCKSEQPQWDDGADTPCTVCGWNEK